MCIYDGQLYVGGNFGSCDGNTSNNVGMWNGNDWSTIGTGMNGMVRSFSVYHNYLYIGGSFTNADGTTTSNVAKYSSATGIVPINATVDFLSLYPNPASPSVYMNWTQNDLSPVTVTIYDGVGRQVREWNLGTLSTGDHSQSFDVSTWNDGIYLISLNNDVRHAVKLIVANSK
jgi:hypothetical protein